VVGYQYSIIVAVVYQYGSVIVVGYQYSIIVAVVYQYGSVIVVVPV
jgi:hypothetical protein